MTVEKNSKEILDRLVDQFLQRAVDRFEKTSRNRETNSIWDKPMFKNPFEQFKDKPWLPWFNKDTAKQTDGASKSPNPEKNIGDCQNQLTTKLKQTNERLTEVRELLKNISKAFDDRKISNKDDLFPTVVSKSFKNLIEGVKVELPL